MQESKIFLSSSRYECFGLAAAEAGTCGCKVFFDVRFLRNASYKGALLLQKFNASTFALSEPCMVAKSFITKFFLLI
jgi:hypothetical protein